MKKLFLVLVLWLCAGAVYGQPFGGIPPAPQRVLFANLGTPLNGNWRFCTDCSATTPATGGGTGAFCYRTGSAWNCVTGAAAAPAYPLLAPDGTAAAPSYAFANSATTGFFRSAANAIGFSTTGVERWTMSASGGWNCTVDGGCDIGNGAADPRDLSLKRNLILRGSTSGTTTVSSGAVAVSSVLTLPVATDTLVGKATTDTLTNKTLTTPTIANFTNATHSHQNNAGGGTLAEAALAMTDITTNNVSTTKHGFVPKAPNVATQYLDGTGAYSTPTGGVTCSGCTANILPKSLVGGTSLQNSSITDDGTNISTAEGIRTSSTNGFVSGTGLTATDLIWRKPTTARPFGTTSTQVTWQSAYGDLSDTAPIEVAKVSVATGGGYYFGSGDIALTQLNGDELVTGTTSGAALAPHRASVFRFGGADAGVSRGAANVVCMGNGTAGNCGGWSQTGGTSRVKTSDVTNATATMSAVTGLTSTLIAGHFYSGEMVIKCINSTATEGIQFDFNGGTATMTSFFAGGGILASGGTDVIGNNISTALGAAITFTTFTGESVVTIKFSFKVNAAGTFIPRFAENTSAVGTATVRVDSYMILTDTQ